MKKPSQSGPPQRLSLDLSLWRLQDVRRRKWREGFLLRGTEAALAGVLHVLEQLRTLDERTVRLLTHAPAPSEIEPLAAEHGVRFEFLSECVLQFARKTKSESAFQEGPTLRVSIGPAGLEELEAAVRSQLGRSPRSPAHGRGTSFGLWVTPDWLGAE